MAQLTRKYTAVNVTAGSVHGEAVVEGEKVSFTKPAILAELIPAKGGNGTIKVAFSGADITIGRQLKEGATVEVSFNF